MNPPNHRSLYRRRCHRSRHRIGAGRPLQQRDRVVRAGRAPVRRQPERGTYDAAVDRCPARSPADAGVGQAQQRAQAAFQATLARQAPRCQRQPGLCARARKRALVWPAAHHNWPRSSGQPHRPFKPPEWLVDAPVVTVPHKLARLPIIRLNLALPSAITIPNG
jgi:hypothetical protein